MIERNGKHMAITKRDWKLFRTKLLGWQEAYMGRLVREYQELLRGPEYTSDKFWELGKRILVCFWK